MCMRYSYNLISTVNTVCKHSLSKGFIKEEFYELIIVTAVVALAASIQYTPPQVVTPSKHEAFSRCCFNVGPAS